MSPDTPFTGADLRYLRMLLLHQSLSQFAVSLSHHNPACTYHRATISYWEHHYKSTPLPLHLTDTILAYAEVQRISLAQLHHRKAVLFCSWPDLTNT